MLYPALDVANVEGDLVLAVADEYSPTAVEDHDRSVTIFFPDNKRRDAARDAIATEWPDAVLCTREVDDEDWARRSQEGLEPIAVGRIAIVPGPQYLTSNPQSLILDPLTIVIEPSMGFGTGHHATTRLCLRALQTIDLTGASVVDMGTGSGVLAIAARLLGARRASGIDDDADAIQAANRNLSLNPAIDDVRFHEADLVAWLSLPATDSRPPALTRGNVVTANLTGALLIRAAEWLAGATDAGGSLIVSGLLAAERDDVMAAFAGLGMQPVWQSEEDGWVGLVLRRRD